MTVRQLEIPKRPVSQFGHAANGSRIVQRSVAQSMDGGGQARLRYGSGKEEQ